MEFDKIKNTSKYPTTLIVKGLNYIGIELAKTLIEQGGYVIIVDELMDHHEEILSEVRNEKLLSIIDIDGIAGLEDRMRRLDYVFYFGHESKSYLEEISSQQFLQESNYLDNILDLSLKFDSKFLLTTSIKAHQYTLETSEFGIMSKNDNFQIPKYSETEIQRYSENLTLEYQNKLNLNVRILRIGEILGKGVNPDTQLPFMKMIVNAINGKPLEVIGDGLETDFYINYLDGANGLIKAMFSLNTKGKIFSLAIPEEISLLSIAYKIADVEPNSGEIKFVDFDGKLPPLRLYKPAPNLNVLGWEYKIGIERSLKQTIEFIKEYESILFDEANKPSVEKNESDEENKTPKERFGDGALARLIEERKMHEQNRVGSVVVANQRIKEKFAKDNNIFSKVSRYIFWVFENLKNQFKFLKNITIREFVFYIIFLILVINLYIFVLSPLLNLGSNVYMLYNNIQNTDQLISEYKYDEAATKIGASSQNIEQIQLRLEDLRFLFVVSTQINKYSEIQSSLQIQNDYLESLSTTYDSFSDLSNYLLEPNSNIVLRTTDLSTIDVQPSQNTLNASELENNYASLQLSIEKLKLNSSQIEKSFDIYPDFLKERFQPEFVDFDSNVELLDSLYKNYEYISPIAGINDQSSHLIVLKDNTRFTSSGGAFSGYILITLENGVITQARSNSFNELLDRKVQLQEFELTDLNLVSTIDIVNNETELKNLALMKDSQLQMSILERFMESELGLDIDIIASMDVLTLSQIIGSESILLQNISFNQDSILTNLATISSDNKDTRNDAILSLSANLLIDIVNNRNIINKSPIITSNISQRNIELYSSKPQLKKLIDKYKSNISNNSDFVKLGIIADQEKISSRFPTVSISGEITVDQNIVRKNLTYKFSGLDTTSSSWLCAPAGSKLFEFDTLEARFYSTNFSQNEICQVFTDPSRDEIKIQFESPNYEKLLGSEYEYIFQLAKMHGINLEYNIEFIFASSEVVSAEREPTLSRTNRFVYSGSANQDLIFRFNTNGQ